MPNQIIKLNSSWLIHLQDEFKKPYFLALKHFLLEEKNAGKTIYPPGNQIFAALNHTPLDNVKVVVLGQDPYHGPGQANGLCFSVNQGIRIPPSLQNIFKEIVADTGGKLPQHGDLSNWAAQGVLLLNATLTVRANEAGSHQGKGWEIFTDRVIQIISEQKANVVFLLWGRFAQSKEPLIDGKKHFILKAAHPSPLSAHNGFMGCRHFSATNNFLKTNGLEQIKWL